MKRSEVREHIFRILFCVEFCEKEEFEDQVELYFHGHENINEKNFDLCSYNNHIDRYDYLPAVRLY